MSDRAPIHYIHYSLSTSGTEVHINHMIGNHDNNGNHGNNNNNNTHQLTRSFHQAFKECILTDISLKLQGKVLKCHKGVLYAYSEYFRTLFTSGFKDSSASEVDLSNLDPDSVDQVVQYCYTGRMSFEKDCLDSIVETVNFLGIDSILSECDYYIMSTLTRQNVPHYYSMSRSHGLPNTQQRLEMKYLDLIYGTEDFKSLPYESVWRILTSENLDISSEMTVLEAASSWLENNSDKDSSGSILGAVQKRLLLPDYRPSDPDIADQLIKSEEHVVHRKVFCQADALIFHSVKTGGLPLFSIVLDPYRQSMVMEGPPTPWSVNDVACGKLAAHGFYCMAIFKKRYSPVGTDYKLKAYLRGSSMEDQTCHFEQDNAFVVFLYDDIEKRLYNIPVNRDIEVTSFCRNVTLGEELYLFARNEDENVMYCLDLESKVCDKIQIDPQFLPFTDRNICVTSSDKDLYIFQEQTEAGIYEKPVFYKYEPENDSWHLLQVPSFVGILLSPALLYHNKGVYFAALNLVSKSPTVIHLFVAKYGEQNSDWSIINRTTIDQQSFRHFAFKDNILRVINTNAGKFMYIEDVDMRVFDFEANVWVPNEHVCAQGSEFHTLEDCSATDIIGTRICLSEQDVDDLNAHDAQTGQVSNTRTMDIDQILNMYVQI